MHDGYLDPMGMKVEHPYGVHHSHAQRNHEYRPEQIMDIHAEQSPRNSPANEYQHFNFGTSGDGLYQRPFQPQFSAPEPLPPLNTSTPTLWPSQITNPSGQVSPPISLPTHRPIAPVTQSVPRKTPPSASSKAANPASTSRKTLSDDDRRRMCKYHDENPTIKQTEIGAMFGVERSTVSKVLRQKEKYLVPDDGARSPVKRAKGRFPDVERTLLRWVKKRMAEGQPVTDELIKDEARKFASTLGNTDSHSTINDPVWLEKFKSKNDLPGAKPREPQKTSKGGEDLSPRSKSGSQTPISAALGIGWDGVPVSSAKASDEFKTKSPDSYYDPSSAWSHQHSQSTASLGSCFSDATIASSTNSYVGGATDFRSPTSPYFSPMSSCGPSPAVSAQKQNYLPPIAPASSLKRRQTVPVIPTKSPSDSSNPSRGAFSALPGEMEASSSGAIGSSRPSALGLKPIASNSGQSPLSMAPPGLPAVGSSPTVPPSKDEARDALKTLMEYIHRCPEGMIDPHDYIVIGKLMQLLKLDAPGTPLPGGMHSLVSEGAGGMVERADGTLPMGRKRSEHSFN